MVLIAPEPAEQQRLEAAIAEIIAATNVHAKQNPNLVSVDLTTGHLHTVLDFVATEKYLRTFEGYSLFLEDHLQERPGARLLVADPNDGSTPARFLGPHHSPLSTSAMVIENDRVIAAAAGDLWTEAIFGIDKEGLYRRAGGVEERIRIRPTLQTPAIRIAAYAQRKQDRGILGVGLSQLVADEKLQSFMNDGGGLYPLLVALNPDGINVAAELKAVPLYEHTPYIMATLAGAKMSRADGSAFTLDHTIDQTCVVSATTALQGRMLLLLKEFYAQLPKTFPHVQQHVDK